MSLAEKLRQQSEELKNKNQAVADEIVEYVRQKINEPKYEEYIEKLCSEHDAKLKRMVKTTVEFWAYSSGCSNTYFYVPGIRWENPEVEGYGYQSNYYKGVDLREIQRIVGPRLLQLIVNKLQEFGLSVHYYSDESWLKNYRQRLEITW